MNEEMKQSNRERQLYEDAEKIKSRKIIPIKMWRWHYSDSEYGSVMTKDEAMRNLEDVMTWHRYGCRVWKRFSDDTTYYFHTVDDLVKTEKSDDWAGVPYITQVACEEKE